MKNIPKFFFIFGGSRKGYGIDRDTWRQPKRKVRYIPMRGILCL